MIAKEMLFSALEKQKIAITEDEWKRFDQYAQLLVAWNEKVNLTAITEPAEIVQKHFTDSLLLLKAMEVPENATLIDVGTGAGFPAVPLCIVRADLKLTLLDSLNKRVLFLKELCATLDIPANCVHARAEEGGQQTAFREKFDLATARAVANLRELTEYCLPFVKVGGVFAALKGYEIEEELEGALYAIQQLGGEVEAVKKYVLGDDARRAIVLIRKVRPTPLKYPRISAKIQKNPLITR